MIEFTDAINEIKFGSIIFIDSINSYIRKYDGDIFKDVKTVRLGNILDELSSIKLLLSEGYIFHIMYDMEHEEYINIIHKGDFDTSKKEVIIEEESDMYEIVGASLIDCIIELDTQIAKQINLSKPMKKMQIYS